MKYLSLILIYTSLIIAQFNPGAKEISLANSDVAMSNDAFAIFNNPAGLAQINWKEIGVYYSPAPFGLTELANAYVAYHHPFDFGSMAIGGMTYGFELYRESKFTISYSYNYDNKFFTGIAANIHSLTIKNYGDDLTLYFNIGSLYYLQKDLRIGFSIQNLNRATFGDEKDQIPTIINTGLSYDLLNELTFNIAIEKDISLNTSVMMGIDYDVIEFLSLRTGFSTEPSRFTAGIGITKE